MAILLAVAWVLPFNSIDIPPGVRARVSVLDGLRGFLAFGVFFHHGAIYHRYIFDGFWTEPPSATFNLFGQVGVSIFFMITGYLFWSRMISEGGQPNWLNLFVGRIFRIGPLYLVAVAVMLAVVISSTGLRMREPTFQLFTHVFRWSLLGLVKGADINGYENPGRVLADVTWTLRYEWWFYLSLPLTAILIRNFKTHLTIVAAGLVASLSYLAFQAEPGRFALAAACVSLFFQGMCCAALESEGLTLRLPDWITSTLVVTILIIIFSIFQTAYVAPAVLLLGIVFYLIISGTSVFGLLLTRPARRLGDISYGIYLLQGIVLYFVFSIEPVRALALTAPALHWGVILLCALLLLVFAAITHHLVELPGIRFGKVIAATIRRNLSSKSAAA
jgi:peptidoglycan/LPS O-acetylase OafA/YrhL